MIKKTFITIFMMAFLISSVSAGDLVVEADNSLEWYRDKKLYLAKGNAKATQDNKSISAEIIYAHYNNTTDKDIDIWKIEAEDNVLITNDDIKIMGKKAIYNMEIKIFEITGDNLNVLSDTHQIKANKIIKYFEDQNKIIAIGDVIVYHEDNEINCDKLTANLQENSEGKMEISELFLESRVKIITPTDIITSETGYYNVRTETAQAESNVVISRENSVITGDKAEISMRSGIAKMTSSGERVRAIFITEDK